ncbi:MAG: FimB/Mfa2 family fimbrial subunit [Muribaculaceae bacterium]|nr:FimB/Mfa2 family fimbrial subunit [Muribaculaceae bacterium]
MFLSFLNQYRGAALAAGFVGLALCSCDSSFIYDDLPPCIPEYKVRLLYTYNMQNVNRVDQVEAAEVYAFDSDGNLSASVKADRQTLIDNAWTLPLELERSKKYDIIVWAGLTDDSPFSLDGYRSFASKEDLTCRLNTKIDEEGSITSDMVFPPLFHGATSVKYEVEDGQEVYEAPLIKNTNTIDVIVRKSNGEPVEEDYYFVEMTDANGVMDCANNVSGDNIQYHHASFASEQLPLPDGEGDLQSQTSEAGRWQFHTARLMKDSSARLKISLGHSNINLIDTGLIDLLLASKAYEAPYMDDQEYLDRQDSYSLDFKLRVDEKWAVVEIYVNDWLVVVNDVEWKK